MKGKAITQLPVKRVKRCPHVHWSGRRCSTAIAPKASECAVHRFMEWDGDDRCPECAAMKHAFGLL